MKFCKYCGTQIQEDAKVCPNCGKQLEVKSDPENPWKRRIAAIFKWIDALDKKWKILAGGVAAALICVIVVLSASGGKCKYGGCKNKPVPGMDYCYTHKCAISSCNKPVYGYSNFCVSHYFLYDDDATQTYSSVFASDLKISGISLTNSGSYTVVTGKITNDSSQTVSYVKIKGAFVNVMGDVLDTDWTYAVGSEGLAPGESCSWRMSVEKDWNIKDCKVTILDFDYD